jgi:GNAT superfamily N-acetyltransferase
MAWRDRHQDRAGRKATMRELVGSGSVPGLLAYRDGQPVGWLSLGWRQELEGLQRSPTLRPRDEDQAVMAIVCLYVDIGSRTCGVSTELITAALDYCRGLGATAVEAYPKAALSRHAAEGGRAEENDSFMGRRGQLERQGFEVVRQAGARLVMSAQLG